MAAKPLLLTLQHVWPTLERLGCRPVLMGGLAVSVWGHVRATQDVDLLVALGQVPIAQVLDELRKHALRLKSPDTPLIDLGGVRFSQLLYEPPGTFLDIRLDLLLAESEFHQQIVARRVSQRLTDLNIDLSVVTCEDLILLKLNAGRILDRVDIINLLRLNRANLDFAHLNGWVTKLSLGQTWAEIWLEAFPGETVPT